MVEKVSGSSPVDPLKMQQLQQAAKAAEVVQTESEEDFMQWCELSAFNPLAMARRFRSLHELKAAEQELGEQERAREEEELEQERVGKIEKSEETAMRFHRNNNELLSKTLLILRSQISAKDSPEEIIAKVLKTYPDAALADEALDFLLETSDAQTSAVVRIAKEQFSSRFEREIKAGRNMGAASREFSKEGLGSATALRDMYRDITGNPREPLKLFEELSNRFPYDRLRTAITFLLHSLGADFRAKGPSISRPELKRLIDDVRSLQGVLGVYRYFKEQMRFLQRQFGSNDLAMPARLTFDALAKEFIRCVAERFISPEKILQSAKMLGISQETLAQIIVYSLMRDALKQIAPRFYRNQKHKDELYETFLKTLEELEEELEDEEEE